MLRRCREWGWVWKGCSFSLKFFSPRSSTVIFSLSHHLFPVSLTLSAIFVSWAFIGLFRCLFLPCLHLIYFQPLLFPLFLCLVSLFLFSGTSRFLFSTFTWKLLLDDSGLSPSLPQLPIYLFIWSVPSNPVQHETQPTFKNTEKKYILEWKKPWLWIMQRVEGGFQKQEVLWEKTQNDHSRCTKVFFAGRRRIFLAQMKYVYFSLGR